MRTVLVPLFVLLSVAGSAHAQVRFVAKRPDRQAFITVRVDNGKRSSPWQWEPGPVPEGGMLLGRCTTPCELDLPDGKVRVRVERVDGPERHYEETLDVPPRRALVTVDIGSRAGILLSLPIIVGAASLETGLLFTIASAGGAGSSDCKACAPILAGSIALTVGAVALLGMAFGLLASHAAGRDHLDVTDDEDDDEQQPAAAKAQTPRVRLVRLGVGPGVGFSF